MRSQRTCVQRACEHCTQPFLAWPYEIARGNGRFCSKSCATHGRWDAQGRLSAETRQQNKWKSDRRYRVEHLEEKRAKDREYGKTNAIAARVRAKAWSIAHPEEARQRTRRWKRAHRAAVYRWAAIARQRRGPQYREKAHQHRARKFGAFVAAVDWRDVWERDGRSCRRCQKALPFRAMELDHIRPLSRGGTHEPRNVQALCGFCNRSKGHAGAGQLRMLG